MSYEFQFFVLHFCQFPIIINRSGARLSNAKVEDYRSSAMFSSSRLAPNSIVPLTENDSRWSGVHVQPERHPRYGDDENRRYVVVHHEEAHFTRQFEGDAYGAKISGCNAILFRRYRHGIVVRRTDRRVYGRNYSEKCIYMCIK